MKNLNELFKGKKYIAELLNGHCTPKTEKHDCAPVNPDWIDLEMSEYVTDAFRRLLPDGMPYLSYIIAEKNPDTLCGGVCVDDDKKRMRYFVITILPDTEKPFNYSFPLIQQMWTFSFACWEIVRATLVACSADLQVVLANRPVPPLLNNAVVEWVSLYLGKEPYKGINMLSEQWVETEEYDGIEADVHLYKVREMEENPVLKRLITAFDEDCSDCEKLKR